MAVVAIEATEHHGSGLVDGYKWSVRRSVVTRQGMHEATGLPCRHALDDLSWRHRLRRACGRSTHRESPSTVNVMMDLFVRLKNASISGMASAA